MTRVTKREVLRTKANEPADDRPELRPHATVKTWPPMRAAHPSPSLPPPPRRPSRVVRNVEAGEHEQDERLRTALGWGRFETWCAANGFRPATTRETIAIVALYMTYLAATGRSVALIARALLRLRDERD
jgi:hypothetical protein